MKSQTTPSAWLRRGARTGFTLTEIMIASAISLVVITAVLAVVLAVTRSARKSEFLAEALQNSRDVQEFMKVEISSAIKKDIAAENLGLTFAIPSGTGRYARLSYRVPICNPLQIAEDVKQTDSVIKLITPAGITLAEGDYVVIASPLTGNRLRVVGVVDPGPATTRNVTLSLGMTLGAATAGNARDIAASDTVFVSVYRDRKFEVDDPGAAAVTTLRYWENTANNGTVRTLSTRVAASERFMFEPVPNDLAEATPAKEHAVRWYFTFQGTNPVSGILGGNKPFWERNVTSGVLWARSGDPENPSGNTNINAFSSSIPTTSTTTTTTTVATTTSVATTSTSKTTTTSIKTTSTTKPSTTSIKTTSVATTKATTTVATTKPTTLPTTAPTTKPPTTIQDG